MRTFLTLIGLSAVLAIVQLDSPFRGLALEGSGLDLAFGLAAVFTFVVATAYGVVHGPATRSVALLLWALVFLVFGTLFLTIGGPGPRRLSINDVALALAAGLFVLSIEEGIRAVLHWRSARAARAPARTQPDPAA